MPATAPVRRAIDETGSSFETMRSWASTVPIRRLGSLGSTRTTETTSGPAVVSRRYVARTTPGATSSGSTFLAVTSGNGAGGASAAGSVAARALAPAASASAHAPAASRV